MVDVNLAVVSGQRIIQAVNLTATGNPIVIKAIKDARYVLAEGEKLYGPENLTLQRNGKDLWLMLEGHNQPQLIIESFYDKPGELVGRGEDGRWHHYIAANADHAQDPVMLQQGDLSPVLLSAESAEALENLSVDSNALALGLIGVGVVGAAAALVFLSQSNSHDDNGKHATPAPKENDESAMVDPVTEETSADLPADEDQSLNPSLPVIGAITDDVGSEQGELLPEQITDDNQPTLSGADLIAGSIIEVRDGANVLGSTVVDADGNWQYTPENALADGRHEFVVVVTDPSGSISAPSDPATVIIESSSANISSVFNLEDLLPANSDYLDWAQASSANALADQMQLNSTGEQHNQTLDDLLNTDYHPV